MLFLSISSKQDISSLNILHVLKYKWEIYAQSSLRSSKYEFPYLYYYSYI